MTRYSQKQLSEAFDLVKNKKHWKLPINAVVSVEEAAVVQAAIAHFAYGMSEVSRARKGKVRIKAPGYYAAEDMLENMFR